MPTRAAIRAKFAADLAALSPAQLRELEAQRAAAVAARATRDAAEAVRSLAAFVRGAWKIVEPGRPLVWNWHLDILCDALERQTMGDPGFRRLLICIPPGTMKSLLVSVFRPAWRWLHRPEHRGLFLANADDLVMRDSRRTRDIITSEWYAGLVAHQAETGAVPAWGLAHDQNEKINFATTQQGFRQCQSIFARITGKRADSIDIDDPLDARSVVNGSLEQVSRRVAEVANVIGRVLPNRVNDLATSTWTLIMQRLHPDDPAGVALRESGWRIIQIQMEFEPDDPLNHPDDPRTGPGELMFPALFARDVLDDLKSPSRLGARWYEAQYQQRPSLPSGGLIQRAWMQRTYAGDPQRLQVDEVVISVDCTFRGQAHNDRVAMHAWGHRRKASFYLLDRITTPMTYTQTRAALRGMCAKWPSCRLKLIEAKANGDALIDDLMNEIPGLVAYDPKVSKEARVQVTAHLWEAGNVWLPAPEWLPGVLDLIEEHVNFPGSHDDDVDAASQFLLRFTSTTPTALDRARAMAGLAAGR